MIDFPKIISTLLYKKTAPTIFGKLRYALGLIYDNVMVTDALGDIGVSKDILQDGKSLYELLTTVFKDEGLNDDIDYIVEGYDVKVDELRNIAYRSDELLLAYQQELVQATGVSVIKVKYVSTQ
jgi:DNA mismatch repair ATPase MutS